MLNLKPLLEYQEIDFALKRIRREIEKHPDQARFEKTRADYNAARKTVLENEEAAGKIVSFYQKTLEGYSDYEKKVEEMLAKLESLSEGDESRKAIILEMESMRNRLASIEKRLHESKAAADAIIKTSTEARMRQKKLKEEGAKFSGLIETFKKEREPKIAELSGKLSQKHGDVDPKLMERYMRLSADKKYPPVNEVKILDKSYYCYCGIELSGSAKEELVDKEFCNCGHCGRIVYLKKT